MTTVAAYLHAMEAPVRDADLEPHALADLFPMMNDDDYARLRESMRTRQFEPIVLYEGKILDGRNRWRACRELDIPCFRRSFNPQREGDPLAFVIAKNLARRHLTTSQRALIAARIANMKQGERTDLSQNCERLSRADAAQQMNVSPRSVDHARETLERGGPEVVAAVEQGKLPVATAATLTKLSISEQARLLAQCTPAAIKAAARGLRVQDNHARREERMTRLADTIARARPLPSTPIYGVIYADPPWRFEAGDGERSTENHYPTMSLDAVRALDVGGLAARDALLFLWTRAGTLPAALDLMAHWGFAYVSNCVWIKDRIGTGYWFREQHEILLLGKRGAFPAPAMGRAFPSVLAAPRARVSEKPDAFYAIIEAMAGPVPRVELFARLTPHGKHAREGWDVWGNEA